MLLLGVLVVVLLLVVLMLVDAADLLVATRLGDPRQFVAVPADVVVPPMRLVFGHRLVLLLDLPVLGTFVVVLLYHVDEYLRQLPG